MSETGQERLTGIEDATLGVIASQASGFQDIRCHEIQVQEVSGGLDFGTNVQRILGTGVARGETISWRAIMKTFFARPGNNDPQAGHFWKREANYYASGQLDHLPHGLRAPRCYAVNELPDRVQVFLEDLQVSPTRPLPGLDWRPEDYRAAAVCLGRSNGAYLTGELPIPAGEWIPSRWLRSFLEEAAPLIESYFRSLDRPLVRRAFAPIPPELLRKVWEERDVILKVLESLPQTFCHQDAFCRNLFLERVPTGSQLIGVDWSYTGPAAVGSELSPFISASRGLCFLSNKLAGELTALAIEGYMEGLAEVGWQCDADLIQFVFNASTFWRYPIASFIGESLPVLLNEAAYLEFEKRGGIPIEQFADRIAGGIEALLPRYSETWRLMKKLNLNLTE